MTIKGTLKGKLQRIYHGCQNSNYSKSNYSATTDTSPVPWNGLTDDHSGEAFLEVHCFLFHKLPDEASYY